MISEFNALMDKILQFYAGEQFQDEMRLAKRDFFDSSSIFDEGSSHFELRMAQFFDWYFFSRKLRGFDCSPLDGALLPRELKYNPAELEMLTIMKRHRHSLFEYLKAKDGALIIRDLIADKKLTVKESPFMTGFAADEIFQVRLIPIGDSYIFTRGFCFHPPEARKFVLKEAKHYRKNPDLNVEELLLRLTKMRYKYEQYKHVTVDKIYSHNP
jgi:hypothetical protein